MFLLPWKPVSQLTWSLNALQPPEHQHHQRTSPQWVLLSPAADGGAESPIVEVGMMHIQCEIHDYMTSESEFITDQHLCLGPVSQPQPLTFSLGSFAAFHPAKLRSVWHFIACQGLNLGGFYSFPLTTSLCIPPFEIHIFSVNRRCVFIWGSTKQWL